MNNDNPLTEYQKQCEYCGNPPGTRCESNPSNCPYKREPIEEKDHDRSNNIF